eukprot:TRINITY_DN6868_c0_g2_i1.p1 TRINITY_DN6868_c0_g2~~TRINITY_DN6868_c0_g2_i1.p1  ORF type:complete len:562 (-),score=99.81 TRINITY_DN6868_c0_g2_i1:552-2237(-)
MSQCEGAQEEDICQQLRKDFSALQTSMWDLCSRFESFSHQQQTLVIEQSNLLRKLVGQEPSHGFQDIVPHFDPGNDNAPSKCDDTSTHFPTAIGNRTASNLPQQKSKVSAADDSIKIKRKEKAPEPVSFGAFEFARQLKQNARTNLSEETYDVAKYYHKGLSAQLAHSDHFQHLTLFVVALNALYLGIDADWNTADSIAKSEWQFIISENIFCTYFFVEWFVRFCAFERKWYCLKDNWFKFDSALVFLMVCETWLMPLITILSGSQDTQLPTAPLRLLRLMRLSRMVRLLRMFPELVTLIKGLATAARAVGSSLFMVTIILYVFSITLNLTLKDEDWNAGFKTIPDTMWTLMINGALVDDVMDVLGALRDTENFKAYIAICIFLVFIMLVVFTILNMLIGIMVEVVGAVAASENDASAVRLMKDRLLSELRKYDSTQTEALNKADFELFMADPQTHRTFQQLDVDQLYVTEMTGMLYEHDKDELSFEYILDLMLTSRGDTPLTVTHMARCHAFVQWSIHDTFRQRYDMFTPGHHMAAAPAWRRQDTLAPIVSSRGETQVFV